MADLHTLTCQTCGNIGLDDGCDGFFYCLRCGSQAEDIIDTGVADEDFVDKGETGGAIYLASHRRHRPTAIKAEPISQYDSQSMFLKSMCLGDETPQPHEAQIKVDENDFSQFDGLGASIPADFGGSSGVKVLSFEDYYNEIRMRYVMGLQIMIELQCEVLVKEFKVSPLVCGLIAPIWLRFISGTGIYDDNWADQAIHDSEMQQQEEPEDYKPRAKYRAEPHNMYGQRAVTIWYRSLRKRIPLACSVAISFLVCHIAREAVLPTDIMKWTLEGKLPYFSAFLEIERQIGEPSSACPISSSVMFRPSQAIPLQKLESLAASIALSIGLELPPVNFYAIALRYLQKLSLPVDNILPHACRIYEWSMPPNLWLSTNEYRLPTRVCVLSILIVAIRIMYNINGFGEWEKSLSHDNGASKKSSIDSKVQDDSKMGTGFPSLNEVDLDKNSDKDFPQPHKSDLDTVGLLHHLQARYYEIDDSPEYAKDLSTYLQYCKDVVFAGSELSFEDHEEKRMIEYLWNFYGNEKDSEATAPSERSDSSSKKMRFRDADVVSRTFKERNKIKECFNESLCDDNTCLAGDSQESLNIDHSFENLQDYEDSKFGESPSMTLKGEAIKQMKLEMEENKFCYIPPRVKLKKSDYLHYARKQDKGALTYVAHADYYILLRICARLAQVDIRIMHIGVLSFEKRLAWLENRIDHCLHWKPTNISCQFCSHMDPNDGSDDTLGLSNLNL